MALAGQIAYAGRIPGERIETVRITQDSPTFTSETVVGSITAPLVAGRTYAVVALARWGSDSAGDDIVARIREDDINGATINHGQGEQPGTISSLGFGAVPVYAEYTATATGLKTFVLTGQRNFGSGNCRLDASGAAPAFLLVEYIKG